MGWTFLTFLGIPCTVFVATNKKISGGSKVGFFLILILLVVICAFKA